MLYRFIYFLFVFSFFSNPVYSIDVVVTPEQEVTFTIDENGIENALKDGEPFSGAVIKKGPNEYNMTYFYQNGKRHGVAISYYDNKQIELEITYKNGIKDGEEIKFHANGKPAYKKTYKNNMLNGEEILFDENGKAQKQSFYKDNKLDGKVSYFNDKGEYTKIENYKDNIKHGVEHIVENNVLREENHYVDGVLSGVTKLYSNQYQTDEIVYKDGKKEGIHKTYNKDGSRVEIPYRNNKKSGTGFAYYENGKIANQAEYLNDEKNGLSTRFYKNGNLNAVETYKKGKQDGISRYFANNGDLLFVSYYVEGTELAKVDVAKNTILNDIYSAYKNGKLNNYTSKKNLWYPILWLGLNANKQDIIAELEKEMKMYASDLQDTKVYKRESKLEYETYNRNLFFGLTPLSYAVNLSAPVDVLQKFATPANISEINARGSSALEEAIRLNNLDMVKYLVLQKADVSKKYSSGNTILLSALKEQVQPAIVLELLKAGADANAVDTQQNTPLILAIEQSDAEIINHLAEHGANLQALNNKGETMLFFAYKNKVPTEILLSMIEAGADVNKKDAQGNVLLVEVLKNKDIQFAQKLIDYSADINLAGADGNSALTYVLHNETEFASTPIINNIFAQKLDVKNNIGSQRQPLWKIVLSSKRLDLLQKVFEQMKNIDVADINGEIPLYNILDNYNNNKQYTNLVLSFVSKADDKLLWWAIRNKDIEILQQILAKEADVNSLNAEKEMALTYVVKNNYPLSFLSTLISYKADINKLNANKEDALYLSIINNNLSVAEYLLKNGANPNRYKGRDAYLLKSKSSEMTNLLLQHNADIQFVEKDKRTMLMNAVEKMDLTLIDYLIEKGTDINARDDEGNIALLYIAEAFISNYEKDEFVGNAKEIIDRFMTQQQDINTRNGNGESLLIRIASKIKKLKDITLAKQRYAELLEYLQSLGMNVDFEDQYGKTADSYLK